MLIKKIVFDCDGVLIDSVSYGIEDVRLVAQSFGCRVPDESELIACWGLIFKEFLEKCMPGISLEMYLERRREIGRDKFLPPRIEGARRALALLASKYPLSLISNREILTLTQILEGHEFQMDLFQFIQTASDTEHHKPDPRVFARLIKILAAEDIREKDILYVGDHLVDRDASVGAGLNFLALLSGGLTTKEEFLQAGVSPEHILESIRDVPGFLGINGDKLKK
jgi:phosphoglycolate phosphatase-like HAD superfamily hydrolase